jgi:hypothetical protein
MDAIQLSINLPFEQLVEAVKKLSPKEKLLLNDAIWDEDMEIPTEQQELVRNRIREAKQNPNSLLDWDEVKKDL